MQRQERLIVLDSFRAIAILTVLMFHYFTRWTFPKNDVSLYPYNDAYDFFEYGHLGVEFFFIISGFVIYFTLEKTTGYLLFWKKRFLRLSPPILVASVLTYTVLLLFDYSGVFKNSSQIKNFISSLTFLPPKLLGNIFGGDWDYIDGSYWSLWPEVQFYFLSSSLFFIKKKKFSRNYIITSLVLIGLNSGVKFLSSKGNEEFVSANFFANYKLFVDEGFSLLNYLAFFSLGFVIYIFYKKKIQKKRPSNIELLYFSFLTFFVLFVHGGLDEPLIVRIFYGLMILLFLLFVYLPRYLKIFENKLLIRIGLSSYFLYLIHQNIGVLFIYNYGWSSSKTAFFLPLALTVLFVIVSIIYSEQLDKKISKWLRTKII